MKPLSVEYFIQKSTEVHNEKYNYSKINYKNNRTILEIICPEHGSFFQQARAHLAGQGCPACGSIISAAKNSLSSIDFINKSTAVHGQQYDYSIVNYVGYAHDVDIICKIHGKFSQKAGNHLSGCGCKKCFDEKCRSTTFLDAAKKVHGDTYDYRLVNYKNNETKVKIICKLHGVFEQEPKNHIQRGQGCRKCTGLTRLTTNEFIQKAKQVHRNKYRYDQVNYKSSRLKVRITCPAHGEFDQRANRHLQGDGCPRCNLSKGELKVEARLKQYGLDYQQQVKFDNCRDKRPLPFDFMIVKNDQTSLIEYNGEQHYSVVNFSSSKAKIQKKHENVKKHDLIKKQWCIVNSIPLCVIPYTDKELLTLDMFLREQNLC